MQTLPTELSTKISVIVPVYNTEDYLPRCLDSILQQTFPHFELIVVDDASCGPVAEIVQSYMQKDSRIKLLRHKQNKGLYQTRLTGINVATGLYISHVDSDDYIDENMLAILYQEAQSSGADIIECNAFEHEVDGTPNTFTTLEFSSLTDDALKDAFFCDKIKHVLWNKLYKRDLWIKVKDLNIVNQHLTITEDFLHSTYLFYYAHKYISVNQNLYHYCRRNESSSMTINVDAFIKKLEDINLVYARIKQFLMNVNSWIIYQQAIMKKKSFDVQWYIHNALSVSQTEEYRYQLAEKLNEKFGSIAETLPFILFSHSQELYWKNTNLQHDIENLRNEKIKLSQEKNDLINSRRYKIGNYLISNLRRALLLH